MITETQCVFTRSDLNRLLGWVRKWDTPMSPMRPYARALQAKLLQGTAVDPCDVPPDTITMKSRVRLRDTVTGESFVCLLVYPDEVDLACECISVLTPLGAALLGLRSGDVLTQQLARSARTLLVEEVLYQPEGAGQLDL